MSKPVIGNPAVDVKLIQELKETVVKAEDLAEAFLDVKNLDEPAMSNARRLLFNLQNAVDKVEFQINEHSRVLIRQSIGGLKT